MLMALAKQGHAPAVFAKTNARGVPVPALLYAALLSLTDLTRAHLDTGLHWRSRSCRSSRRFGVRVSSSRGTYGVSSHPGNILIDRCDVGCLTSVVSLHF